MSSRKMTPGLGVVFLAPDREAGELAAPRRFPIAIAGDTRCDIDIALDQMVDQ